MLSFKELESLPIENVIELLKGKKESKNLEFKSKIKIDTIEEKKEFLADISAFANATGGQIIFGVMEKKGEFEEICGIEVDNEDFIRQKIENMLRDNIEPNLSNYSIKFKNLEENKYIIIIEISDSYSKPHVVNYKGLWRVYSRNSTGKFALDIFDLKNLVLKSNELRSGLDKYRFKRISSIMSEELPFTFENPQSAKLIVHVLPHSSFYEKSEFSLREIRERSALLKPINADGSNVQINFDGLLASVYGSNYSVIDKYLQLYRDGIIETVDGSLTRNEFNIKGIWLDYTCEGIIDFIERVISLYKMIGIVPPIYVLISFINVEDHHILLDQSRYRWDYLKKFDRNRLIIPEVVINNFDTDLRQEFKVSFDMIWNSGGYEHSLR